MAQSFTTRFFSVRFCTLALATAPLALAIDGGNLAFAQQAGATDANKTLFIGTISGDDVYVRSGAGESYYPFYKIHRGDMVKVTGEKYGFVSVTLVGPAFKESFGYIKTSTKDAARIRVAADGKSATTLGRVDIVAPNLDAGNRAKDSWKVIARLEADKTLSVLEATPSGDDMIYKVAMPADAVGWVNAQFVPRAPADEAAMFEDMLAGKTTTPPPVPPVNPPSPDRDAVAANNAANQTPVPQQPTNTTPPAADGTTTIAENPTPPANDLIPVLPVPETTTQPTTEIAKADKPREPMWEDLEKAFKTLQNQPTETAELQPMRDMYAALASRHPEDKRIQRFSDARIKQIDIWSTLQQKKLEVLEATARMKMSSEDAEAARLAIERSAEYTAVGRVAVSNIYDGTSLPKLFRLQDPSTGRTVAYLKPDADYALANRIDVIVGIVGDKVYDESMRLNMITPRRIDVLSPTGTPATPTSTTPAATPGASIAGASTDAEDK